MPGKGDYGADPVAPEGYVPAVWGKGQYYPGSKEYRAWDEGFTANVGGAAKDTVPYTTDLPAEYDAWIAGWEEAKAARPRKYMPAAKK